MARAKTGKPVPGDNGAAHPRSVSVMERLRAAILDGRYPARSRLNEVQLSRELAVSRTPIRAALQTLAGEGLLQYVPNKGFSARGFSVAEIVDAYEMRALAEGLAARLAAERGLSADQQVALEESLKDGDALLTDRRKASQQRARYAELNERFHGTIHAAASSPLLIDVIRQCHRVPQTSAHNIVAFELGDIRQRHAAHHHIYEALICREPRRAEELMREHVLGVKSSLVRAFAAK